MNINGKTVTSIKVDGVELVSTATAIFGASVVCSTADTPPQKIVRAAKKTLEITLAD